MITEYFTLNINILHVVYVFKMEKRITWLMKYVYDKKKKKKKREKNCLRSKEIDG